MDKIKVGQEIDHHRRRLLAAAAMTVASARLAMSGPAVAQPGKAVELPAIKPLACFLARTIKPRGVGRSRVSQAHLLEHR